MAIAQYLAMTAGEIAEKTRLPSHLAWMACHFSPYGTGLSNLPKWLPAGSLLILNDRTPIHDHDPVLIATQLEACAQRLGCSGILLDFQRPGEAQTRELVQCLCRMLSCPVAISEPYADAGEGAVFLPPVPADEPPGSYLSRWHGREIWLETALDAQEITLTEHGAAVYPLAAWDCPENGGFSEPRLHCHYRLNLQEDAAIFTLWRTAGDIQALLDAVAGFGVTAAVGLYQEFCLFHKEYPLPDLEEG